VKKSIANLVFHAFIFIVVLCLPACIHRKQIDKQKLHFSHAITKFNNSCNAPPPITIWVHGTLVFRTPIYHHIFNNQSRVVRAVLLPGNNYFRILAETIAEHDSEHFPLDEFYIFSWSGRLQNKERKDAAEKLYQEIIDLSEEYQKKYGCRPIIRILAHSHGGNVVLNMAQLKKNTTHQPLIKSLILLACPVQAETMHLIKTPMFERVYSLYSSLDIIQILAPQFKYTRIIDPQSMRRKHHYKIFPFSARTFPLYDHLTQAKIKINDYPISHTSFSTKEFGAMLPTILHKLDEWHDESVVNNKLDKHKLLCIYKKRST
jgi:hypothetical protein